jgi:hypothetical protein
MFNGRACILRGAAIPWAPSVLAMLAIVGIAGCARLQNLYPSPPPPVGALQLVPSDLDYGPQPRNSASRPFIFVLSNPPTNDGAAIITQVGTSGPPFVIDPSISTCSGATLAVGSHCQVGVKFAPTAEGKQTGTLAITDNSTSSPQIATLEGVGR